MADSGGDRGGVVASNVAPADSSTSGDGQDSKKSDMGDVSDVCLVLEARVLAF